jgi:serine/threonine protein kinase
MSAGCNPFYSDGQDQMVLFRSIVMDGFDFPYTASDELCDLLDGLLIKDPAYRLGSLAGGELDILRHEWFRSVDLNTLRRRLFPSHLIPWIPKIDNPFDTSNFDDWRHVQDITKRAFPDISEEEEALFAGFEKRREF